MKNTKVVETKKEYSLVEVALLAEAFNKSTQTIIRWIDKEDDRLTSEKAKLALSKNTIK